MMRVILRKEIDLDEAMDSPTIYFSSKTQIVANDLGIDASLTTSFKIILPRIQKWIVQGSCFIKELIDADYFNISIHNPLVGSSCIELPEESRISVKCLINIQNKHNEFFPWRHIRHLNPMKRNLQLINESDKGVVASLNFESIELSTSKKGYHKNETNSNIGINIFGYNIGKKNVFT